jgi:arylsulfatase A-like enzyme
MVDREAPSRRGEFLLLCSAFALTFSFVEWIKAHVSNFWTGESALEYLGALTAFVVYLSILVLIAYVLRAPLRRFTGIVSTLLPVVGAAGLIWLGLALATPELSLKRGAIMAVVCLVLGLLVFAFHRPRIVPARWAAIAFGMMLLSGMRCSTYVGHIELLHPMRAHIIWDAISWNALIIGVVVLITLHRSKEEKVRAARIRNIVIGVVVVHIATTIMWRGAESPGTQESPNILLITCDALRADYLSPYEGHVKTPALDALADVGVTFERAYTLAPWTLPSMNAMYASRYPLGLTPHADDAEWKAEITSYRFDDIQRTLAERLMDDHYSPVLLTANGLVGRRAETVRGFDDIFRLGHQEAGRTGFWSHAPYFRGVLARVLPALADERPSDTTKVLTAHARHWFKNHPGKGLFLWVHFMDPHSPYDPPARFRTMEGPWPVFDPRNPHWGSPQHDASANLPLPEDERAYVRSLYEAEVAYVAEAIGEIIEAAGDNTYICVTADHGEELWDHGRWGHGHSLYDEVARVPLIFAGPGITPARITQPVSLIDVIPTLADLTDVEADPRWQGRSLAAVLRGDDPSTLDRPVITRATNLLSQPEPLEMLVQGDYKLIRGVNTGALELYNLSEDPKERDNFAETESELAATMSTYLTNWNESWPSDFTRALADEGGATLDPEVMNELRSLGYVE